MVDDAAKGVRAAGPRTRVDAFVSSAGFVPRTVLVEDALWSAPLVRITLVLGQARANAVTALGVGAAG